MSSGYGCVASINSLASTDPEPQDADVSQHGSSTYESSARFRLDFGAAN
jgi:hypothetical protein